MTRTGTPVQNRPTPRPSPAAATAAAATDGSNGDAYKAALRGASLAFQNTGSKQPQSAAASASPGRGASNGALIAATSTSHHHGLGPSRSPPQSRTPGTVSKQTTGGSSVQSSRTGGVVGGHENEHESAAQKTQIAPQQSIQQQGLAAAHLLTPPGKQHAPEAKSPSFIAATLAASRSGSPNPRPSPQPTAKRQHGSHAVPYDAESSTASTDLATDTRSLSSANTLISMFEKRDDDTDPVKKRIVTTNDSKPTASSTKPKPKPKPKPKLTPKAQPATPPEAVSTDPKSLASPLGLAGAARVRSQEAPASPTISVKKQRQEPSERAMGPVAEAESSRKRPPTPPAPRSTRNEVSEPSTGIKPSTPKKKPRASTPPRRVSNANVVILSPQPRRASSQKILSHRSSSEDAMAPQVKAPPPVKPKPQRDSTHTVDRSSTQLEKQTRPIVLAEKQRQLSTSSDDTFVSASSVPPSPEHDSPPQQQQRKVPPTTPDPPQPRRSASNQSTASARPRGLQSPLPAPPLPQRQQQQNADIPLASLTNAIVAGSLASQRALTPSTSTSRTSLHPQGSQSQLRKPPSPPSRRQTPRIRQTLRKPDREDEEAAAGGRRHGSEGHGQKPKHRHGKGLFGVGGNSNKHSHHEGQRRRWREEITPRERKRYEGVWASNRGLLMHLDPDAQKGAGEAGVDMGADLVSGIVVRDIWARSRLPADELAEVWDLVVDHRTRSGGGRGGVGGSTDEDKASGGAQGQGGSRTRPRPKDRALDKTEFVVGMWLVDQRLRGRKIPPKVSDSVWGSARGGGIVGVNVKRPKSGKR